MDLDDLDPPTAEDILNGTHAIDLSHAGGEFFELVNEDMKKSRYVILTGDYAFADIVPGGVVRTMMPATGGIGRNAVFLGFQRKCLQS